MSTASTLCIQSLDSLPDIRTFPKIASQIMAACDSPKTTGHDLCELIQCDANVSLRVLRIANSSAYGMSGQIKSLEHAVVILGFRALRTIAVSAAAADLFSSGTAIEAQRNLWSHCIGTAVIAKLLAKHAINVRGDEAFLAGVVHDVGKLVFLDMDADEYVRLTSRQSGSITTFEKLTFGFDHQEIGLRCADEWGLPLDIAESIGFHHRPEDAYHAPEMVGTIQLASELCALWGMSPFAAENADVTHAVASCHVSFDPLFVDSLQPEAHDALAQLRTAFA